MDPATLLVIISVLSLGYASAEQVGVPAGQVVLDLSRPAVVSSHIETLISETERQGNIITDHSKSLCRGYKTRLFDLQLVGAYTPQMGAFALEKCAQLVLNHRPAT